MLKKNIISKKNCVERLNKTFLASVFLTMLSSRVVEILCLFFTFANMMPAPEHFLVETEDDGRLMLVCI